MILVVGGTGQLGGRVVRDLREQGQQVRCLVRAGSDDAKLREQGVELATGDLVDTESLRAACSGVQTVVATASAIGSRLAGARHPSIREADEVGMSALVSAAEDAGVERFVYVSYAGADVVGGSTLERAKATPLSRAKLAVERRLAASSMRSVIARPDAFQEIHLGPMGRFFLDRGTVAVFGKGDTKRRWVSTDDVAALLAAVAVEPDPPAVVEFGGPEALSRNETAAIAEEATGHPMKRQHLPRAATSLGMRLLARPNDALSSVFGAGLLQDLVEAHWDDLPLRQRGITPHTPTDYIRQQAHATR
jgi:uncharacterized protein YbjT (DUF2867 family)